MSDGLIVTLTVLPPLVLTLTMHLVTMACNIHPCGDCHGSGAGRSTTAPPALSIHDSHPICRIDSIQPKSCVSDD
eukprot:scaffold350205_cov35-Attheya_sp.AAC.3